METAQEFIALLQSPSPTIVWALLTAFFFIVFNCILEPAAKAMQQGILRQMRADESLLNLGRSSWTNIGIQSGTYDGGEGRYVCISEGKAHVLMLPYQ